jgi:hypothetical protein
MEIKKVEYYSQAADTMTTDICAAMATEAATRNRATGITGWLNFDGKCFFQYFEGPAPAVDALWKKIQADPRHRDIVVLSVKDIQRRAHEAFSIHLSAQGDSAEALESAARDNWATEDQAGLEDMATSLSLQDILVLSGDSAAMPSLPIGHLVESAGRRWQRLAHKTFIKKMTSRRYNTVTEVAAAMVEDVLTTQRRGGAALPNLRAFLMRRADLVYQEISKTSDRIHVAVFGRGDALDGISPLAFATALTALTFSVRALSEVKPNTLKERNIRRILVNMVRAALDEGGANANQVASLQGSKNWIESLVG